VALFYQHNINGTTKLGIWRIEEQESFFLEKVPLKRDVSHPYKRLQHLAGRYLLPVLFEDFPLSEILVADTRKPFLEQEQYHFSISHCGNFAAAIVSSTHRVGVDIELVTPRLRVISEKFLHEEERLFLQEWEALTQIHLELVTLLWSAKEAVYKWHGEGKLDFKEHMRLSGAITTGAEWITMPFEFRKNTVLPLTVKSKLFDQLGLAWVVT
jgi:4'-phosphopantetheinyl transferase EntD